MDAFRDQSRSPRGDASDDVMNLIYAREQARQMKDFAQADSLREQLQAMGVQLFDKTNSWRSSDGKTGRIPSWQEVENGTDVSQITPANFGASVPPGGGQDAQIKHLVMQREQARAAKDFAQSDALRDELKAMGVEISDKEKMWRSKEGQVGVIVGFRGSAGPTETEITTLIAQREKARQGNDYTTSDLIRDELKALGVEIRDKEKMWRTPDGRSGMIPTWGDQAQVAGAMASVGQAQYGPADLRSQVVQAALQASQNPAAAARTLQVLQQLNGGGGYAQQQQQGYGGGKGYAAGPQIRPTARPTASAHVQQQQQQQPSNNAEAQEATNFISQCVASGRQVTDAEIEWLITLREKMRAGKDFQAADEVRNAMRSQLGVEMHEKEKRWVANDGRQGMIPMWGAIMPQ